MPNLLRAADSSPESWPAALGRAATLGFDTLLLPPGQPPAALIEAAAGLGITLLSDVAIDRAATAALDEAPGPFTRLPAPSTDPRNPPSPAPDAPAALASAADAATLAAWWAPRIDALAKSGVAGVRLLGLASLPGWSVVPFLAALRDACPGCLLFGWTPGLSRSVLATIPPHTLDLVALSLAAWDGRSDGLWQELELLRPIAPVVADAGPDANRHALAAILAEGWMVTAAPKADSQAESQAESLNALRTKRMAGLPWSRLVSPGGGPAWAILRTDTPDPRRATRAGLAMTALTATTMPAYLPLSAIDGPFKPFTGITGDTLSPSTTVRLEPGFVQLYTAASHPAVVAGTLTAKRAEQAGAQSRVAIEAPSPCVDGGRFPARQVVGSTVTVEADIITDGHDKLAAVVRWRVPGSEEWRESPMALVVNDRWRGTFPLDRLGVVHFTIEAWRDIYSTFVDEVQKKHAAGVPITLEMQEGALLIRAAAARMRKGLQAELEAILKALDAGSPDERRETLLSAKTRAAMDRADHRPHKVTIEPLRVQCERPGAGFASWYEVFPRSMSDDPARHGTFRDVVRHLPRIQRMGFDVLYFPPIHPIGRTNRKGRNNTLTPAEDDPGSPYAIGAAEGGHESIHPELGSFEDFQHLRDAAAQHGIELAIDFAIQCAPDHPWLKQHKGWFDWRPDGSIRYAENPPKKYQDIVNVDFYAADAVPNLWLALANAVLFWCKQGVRLFRVDNPHTKPLPFWEWMIGEVQARHPDAVFLAEAFTRPKVMYRLAKAGFSQSYTYFTWRETKADFEQYLNELTQPAEGRTAPRDFFKPHFFVNTPDINPVPLQTAPRQGFLVRAALASTLSGLWGLYNGFELCEATPVPGREEYLDSEKYQIRAWDWDRPGNIVDEVAALNAIRKRNPALHTHLGVTFLRAGNDRVLLFEKATPDRSNVLLIAINVDLRDPQSSRIEVPFWRWTPEPAVLVATDLINGGHERWTARDRDVTLTAAQPYAIWRLRPAEGTL